MREQIKEENILDCVSMGSLIKEKRLLNKMTQKQLGDLLHVSDKAVSKWERGVCFPDISLIEDLAKILNIPVEVLISKENDFQIKKTHQFKNIIAVCIVYSIIGLAMAILYLIRPTGVYIKRIYILGAIGIFFLLFILTFIFLLRGSQMKK